jgi:hypothetical protein
MLFLEVNAMTKRWTIALSLMLMQAFAAVASACPMCKDSITDNGGPDGPTPGLPSGFKVSIYLMLGGLFCVTALVSGVIIKGVRGTNVTPPPPGGFPLD